jgi:hypothetical protein
MYEVKHLGEINNLNIIDEAYSGGFGFFFTFGRGDCDRVYNYRRENFLSDTVQTEVKNETGLSIHFSFSGSKRMRGQEQQSISLAQRY